MILVLVLVVHTTSVSTSIDVFTTGVCDNSLGFQLKAQISAGTYTTPNYIWQKSTDGGNTWVDLYFSHYQSCY